jgi:murein DD-endopeptidase MepM/ murein hydrolase activator NlpD
MFAAGTAALMAGCSDASRFAENPFSDPFGNSSHGVDRAPTGSVSKQRSDSTIQSRPLPPPSTGPSASASPRPVEPLPAQSARAGSTDHWSVEGGTPVVMAQGETPSMIASRYGVPTDALLRVNGFASAQQVQPGARLIIPVYHAIAARPGGKTERAEAPKPAKAAAAANEKPARKSKDVRAEAKTAPGKGRTTLATRNEEDAGSRKETAKLTRAKLAKAEEQAATSGEKRAKSAPVEAPSEKAAESSKTDKTATASIPRQQEEKEAVADARPEFRWPARGRIIQGFSSGGNDGINISLPEGTQVKAAEGGVVAYAGNELKGYGNLVLIRHPNGFVTAYAHNAQLEVKRGDQVKRGQTIARSGQSGNVGSPQLHFELRKGSTPVDPTNYLAGL